MYVGRAAVCRAFGADDWPAWRGPNRDGICQEKGLLQEWPKEGPKLLWKATGLGIGFGGPAVVGDVLYLMGGNEDKEWVFALDVSRQGKLFWASPIGPIRSQGGGKPGPRSTPSVDGDRVYTLGIAGDLVCMDIKDGHILWRHDLVKDFGGAIPQWGYAESVLVDGPWVVCTPGGAQNTIAALDKANGQRVWGSAVGDPADYSSVIKVTIDGVKQYVNLTKKGVIGVAAEDGKYLWRYDAPANKVANCSTCIWQDDMIFASSDYGAGSGLVRIQLRRRRVRARADLFHQEAGEPSRRRDPAGRRPLRLQRRQQPAGHPHLPRLCHRQGEMDGPQLGQGLALVGR